MALPLIAVGCADADESGGEDEGDTASAISGTDGDGDVYVTSARLNFREGPSTDDDIIRTLALGAKVTIQDGTPTDGFYLVENDGDVGYVFGAYLKSGATKVASGTTSTGAKASTATKTGAAPTGQVETCKASYYASGTTTADGERFNTNALTAAHKTLPFNTMVRVTNTANGKTVDVRINDRGPFVSGRCIDLSRAAFTTISSTSAGVASVKVEVLK